MNKTDKSLPDSLFSIVVLFMVFAVAVVSIAAWVMVVVLIPQDIAASSWAFKIAVIILLLLNFFWGRENSSLRAPFGHDQFEELETILFWALVVLNAISVFKAGWGWPFMAFVAIAVVFYFVRWCIFLYREDNYRHPYADRYGFNSEWWHEGFARCPKCQSHKIRITTEDTSWNKYGHFIKCKRCGERGYGSRGFDNTLIHGM